MLLELLCAKKKAIAGMVSKEEDQQIVSTCCVVLCCVVHFFSKFPFSNFPYCSHRGGVRVASRGKLKEKSYINNTSLHDNGKCEINSLNSIFECLQQHVFLKKFPALLILYLHLKSTSTYEKFQALKK